MNESKFLMFIPAGMSIPARHSANAATHTAFFEPSKPTASNSVRNSGRSQITGGIAIKVWFLLSISNNDLIEQRIMLLSLCLIKGTVLLNFKGIS